MGMTKAMLHLYLFACVFLIMPWRNVWWLILNVPNTMKIHDLGPCKEDSMHPPWGSCHPLPFFVSQGDTEGKNNTYNYQADKIKCQCKYESFPPHIYVLFFMEWWMSKTSILKIHLLWIMINTNEMHVSPLVGNFGGNSHLTAYYF